MAGNYDGPVGFGSDGVHYPLDDDGHLDTARPLRWVDGGTYRDAEGDDALHNDTHHVREVGVNPNMLAVHDPGAAIYPVGVHVVSEDAETYYLADEHGNHLDEEPLRWDAATQTFRKDGA